MTINIVKKENTIIIYKNSDKITTLHFTNWLESHIMFAKMSGVLEKYDYSILKFKKNSVIKEFKGVRKSSYIALLEFIIGGNYSER